MSNKQFRSAGRLIHLLVASVVVVFIVSPLRLNGAFVTVVQVGVVPILVISGLVLWQQPAVIKFFNRRRGEAPGKGS